MNAPAHTDFAKLIGPVALELYGEPNRALSRPEELRWGANGGRIVYPNKGAFLDTEANVQGGTLALIQHVTRCDQPAALEWMTQRGIIERRDRGEPVRRPHAARLDPGQRIVATFEYSEAGRLHYRKHRIEPGRGGRNKEFAFDHPDGRGGWTGGRGDAQQIPFLADDLRAAPADAVIVMAEGEAKALKLKAWGFLATSSKDWRHEFADYVRGHRVVILADNDEPGAKLAADVKAKVETANG